MKRQAGDANTLAMTRRAKAKRPLTNWAEAIVEAGLADLRHETGARSARIESSPLRVRRTAGAVIAVPAAAISSATPTTSPPL